MNEFARVLRFAAVGVANTAVGLAVFEALVRLLAIDPTAANAASYVVGVSLSYVLNSRFTFGQDRLSGRAFIRFIGAFAVAYAANLVVFSVLLHLFDWQPTAAQIVSMVVYTATFYLASRAFVFTAASAGKP
ncbi:GtrA family protein [Oricola sp.]|uniref:GtrA family protein n=1 Tax=Oricola sp. TaxID=1979950 RepID=UPI0025D27F1A|nr:GtrA family protein [Oricola sp.]MCI5076738.1 GtrA family protein [Oricola sp.]